MDTWPQWARLLLAVAVFLVIAILLIWLIGAYLWGLVEAVVGVAVVVGLVWLTRQGLRGRQDTLR